MIQHLNRQIVLAHRPSGVLRPEDFRVESAPLPVPGSAQVLIQTILATVSPHARAVMNGPTYRPQLSMGEVIPSSVIGTVLSGPATGPMPGTVVLGAAGWQEFAVLDAAAVRPVPTSGTLSHHLGALGRNGLTAYFGIRKVARIRAGSTVVVSGAAGGVGHVAGQLARIAGARVVGVSGSEAKNTVLQGQLGFTATVNRRSPQFGTELRQACPDGVDVYFDNVGGPVLDAVLPLMNRFGQIVCCGVTAEYDRSSPWAGNPTLGVQTIAKSLRLQGLLVADYLPHWDAAAADLERLIDAGDLVVMEEIHAGLDSGPGALVDLLAGQNLGQTLLRLAPDPSSRRWSADQ